ncbi:MAG: helix-turn-helix domain-containing protein [Piscinibacter sp.]|uniref:GlxA family transcriptional regulator n=1 Tax=Piscinibacter sp. TaxID=1903157 RepID=UPI002587D9CC|nr:helix-turn-helix domain-containing protein [Piscinibacter sp.]MCW5665008.1 helix-turn-helix domain-containing protein [Piscinibacter sp.]
MPRPASPVTVALLAAPEVSAATLYGFYDALSSAGRDWAMLHGAAPDAPLFRPLVVSRDGAPVLGANGVRIQPEAGFADCPPCAVACITDLAVPPGADIGNRYDAEVDWLRQRHAEGTLLASACSGALLLARTGLLDDMDATTHWAYADALRRAHPRVRWHPERGLVVGGTSQRIVMAGSGVAWHQLALYLIARFAGAQEAMQVARINLLDLATASPIAYASLTHGGAADDPLIARCQHWAAEHYRAESPVTRMVELSGLPERSFKRRFQRACGLTPLEYVHMLRLEEAKQLLESGDLPVEAIALEVGYQDASFFGRLFRRKVALTPAQYRRRFQPLARQLRESAGSSGEAEHDAPRQG